MSLYQDYSLEELIAKVAEHDDEADLHIELIKRYIVADHLQSALDQALTTDALIPGNITVQTLRAFCLVNLGQAEEGARLLDALVRQNATCEFQHLVQNEISPLFYRDHGDLTPEEIIQKRIDNAAEGQKEVFQRAKSFLPIQEALQSNDLHLAVQLLTDHIDTFPNDTNAQMGLANVYEMLAENEKAEDLYRNVIKNDPESASAYFGLASVVPELQDQIKAAQTGLKLTPANHCERYNLGVRILQSGDHELARHEWSRIPADDPIYATALAGISESFQLENDWRTAIEYQEKAVTLGGHDPLMHVRLGQLKIDAGFSFEGLESIERAIEMEPESVELQLHKAEALDSMGQTSQAIVNLEDAIEFCPKDFRLGLRLSFYHYNLEQFEEAIEASLMAIEANCDEYASYWNAAVSSARLGKRDDCLNFLKDAVQRNPGAAEKILSDDDLEPFWNDPEFQTLANTNA